MHVTFTHVIGPRRGERIKLAAAKISIGRAPDNMLCLGEGARRVSAHHAEVTRRGAQYLLHDLGSTNGTMINGRRVVISELEPDDLIEFGAGGPLLRFGVETVAADGLSGGERELQSKAAASVLPASQAPSQAHRALRRNAALIVALVAAMLLGGLGGLMASSRLRAANPETMSIAEIAELNAPAVVFIRTEFELLDATGQVTTTEARTGSGFVVSADGLIVTNRHLIRDWEYNTSSTGLTGRVTKTEVILPHQKIGDSIGAEVYKLGPDSSVDVAILKINSPVPRPVRFEHDISSINRGDEVVVIGYPLGLELLEQTRDTTVDPSISTGIVSRVGHDYVQLNLRAYHGGSGGPVLNRKGQVIGILTATIGGARDIALCTPAGAVLALVKTEIQQATERQ